MSLISRHLHALALDPIPPSSEPPRSNLSLLISHLPLLLSHLLALLAVCRLAHWPLWLAPLLLAAFCLPQLVLRRWCFAIESLAPLFALYSLAAIRLFILYALHQEVSPALDYANGAAISAAWAGLIFLKAIRRL